jgi:dihydrofolate reductase
MSGWFSDQVPLILTRNENYSPEDPGTDFHVVQSVEESLTVAAEAGVPELCVCGGAHIYEAALPFTDELLLTRVETEADGTVLFPAYEETIQWETVSETTHEADEENEFAMTFLHLRRTHPSSLRPSRMHWG